MDEPVCILSAGQSVPDSIFSLKDFIALQRSAMDFAISKLDANDMAQKQRIEDIKNNFEWVKKCAENSAIAKRHGIIPEDGNKLQDFYEKYDYNPPYTLRAKYWRRYCPELAMNAVQKALKQWGGDKNLITHVVSHSTTGWDVPGLSHHVMYNLELPTSARAVPVNFVGCQGGTSVMFVASTIAKQDPNAIVLALAAEIQSPLGRMYNDDISLEKSIYMPNVLFGDAAGCAVIGRPDLSLKSDFPKFEYLDMGAHYIPDTRHVLTISVSEEYGLYYENSIKKELPVKLNATLASSFMKWLTSVLGPIHPNDCAYAVHPGGKKLLNNFESLITDYGVKDAKKELQFSYKNLREYGNLASAAIIFILSDVCKNTQKDFIYFMAMGPGVCLEYGGMKRYKPGAKRTASFKAAQTGNGNNYVPLLLAIIMLLVAFIVGGFTVNDLKNLL
jgi:predicted naringenin-chalcone synthase